MKKLQEDERPGLQIDLFELQQEWEWHQEQKKKQEEVKEETVIIIDNY